MFESKSEQTVEQVEGFGIYPKVKSDLFGAVNVVDAEVDYTTGLDVVDFLSDDNPDECTIVYQFTEHINGWYCIGSVTVDVSKHFHDMKEIAKIAANDDEYQEQYPVDIAPSLKLVSSAT